MKPKYNAPLLDYKRMVIEIDKIIQDNGEFLSEMEMRACNYEDKKHSGLIFKVGDAKKMAMLLSEIYLISHCLHCNACQGKYIKDQL